MKEEVVVEVELEGVEAVEMVMQVVSSLTVAGGADDSQRC